MTRQEIRCDVCSCSTDTSTKLVMEHKGKSKEFDFCPSCTAGVENALTQLKSDTVFNGQEFSLDALNLILNRYSLGTRKTITF